MKSMLFGCVLLLSIFVSSVPAYCQSDSSVNVPNSVDGNVVSVDNPNSRIVIKSSEIMTFSVSSNAKIVNMDGFEMQLLDVRPGNYVTVDYHDDKYGKHVMDGMEVEYIR